ncbi:MAG TPA: hypothetical protein VF323_07345 [Candidatus Limnocylindrales bacterium]
MEIVALLVLAVAILVVGVRVGMLLAPRVERMADRADRAIAGTPDPEAPGDTLVAGGTEREAMHEGDHAGTD